MCKSVNIRATTQLCALLFVPVCQAFLPNFWSRVLTLSWDSSTHQYMTEQAILNITMETLSTIMERAQGVDKEELVSIMVACTVLCDKLRSIINTPYGTVK